MDRRVLVVDDDPTMLRLLSKYLTGAHYQVLTACDGEEALQILHREGPSVLLSDWAMPGMDGLELCKAVRSSEVLGFVYVIILTAHSDKERAVQALEAGANDFLAKPFHPQELLARLNAGMRIIGLESDLQRQQRELHKVNADLSILNRKLELMATTDELTGLSNRREAMNCLKAYWANSVRHGQPLSCIMFDIDNFKQCNDTYGHDVGDVVLRQAAEVLKRGSRAGDLACRLGGEEFLIICPNATAAAATNVAERFRKAIESCPMHAGELALKITVSGGVAERGTSTHDFEDLLKFADQALYQAKQNGRNCVEQFAPGTDATLSDEALPA